MVWYHQHKWPYMIVKTFGCELRSETLFRWIKSTTLIITDAFNSMTCRGIEWRLSAAEWFKCMDTNNSYKEGKDFGPGNYVQDAGWNLVGHSSAPPPTSYAVIRRWRDCVLNFQWNEAPFIVEKRLVTSHRIDILLAHDISSFVSIHHILVVTAATFWSVPESLARIVSNHNIRITINNNWI